MFSIVAFKTPTLHKVVYRHTQGVLGSLMTVLLRKQGRRIEHLNYNRMM